MAFNGLPALAQQLKFTRVFVQRSGVVYFGFRGQANLTRSTPRPNLPPAKALFGTLGSRLERAAARLPGSPGRCSRQAQFSKRSFGTRLNSRRLLLTRVAPSASACAAIWASSGPMGVLFFSSALRTSP